MLHVAERRKSMARNLGGISEDVPARPSVEKEGQHGFLKRQSGGGWRDESIPQHIPLHATRNFVSARILHQRQSLGIEWVLRSRSHESQLLLAQVKRKWFLFTWAKSNCDSWLLLRSSHSTSKLCCRWRVSAPTKLCVACKGVCWGMSLDRTWEGAISKESKPIRRPLPYCPTKRSRRLNYKKVPVRRRRRKSPREPLDGISLPKLLSSIHTDDKNDLTRHELTMACIISQ